jgi:hypothetical protein
MGLSPADAQLKRAWRQENRAFLACEESVIVGVWLAAGAGAIDHTAWSVLPAHP